MTAWTALVGDVRPEDDTLPARFTTEPSTMGGSTGHLSELDQMLEELDRWLRTGVPPAAPGEVWIAPIIVQ